MIGLSLLSSVSKHNMWSYYDWVYCCCLPSVNTICDRIMIGLIRPHIVFTDGRPRQLNHNTTTYCVYWRTTTTINPNIIRPDSIMTGFIVVVFVSKHNMWSYYVWVYCCCRPSVNTICGSIMTRFIVVVDNNDNLIRIRPHIVFTDGRQQQQQLNHNTTTYCVYWRKTTTTQS
jgi:hypothetical protein